METHTGYDLAKGLLCSRGPVRMTVLAVVKVGGANILIINAWKWLKNKQNGNRVVSRGREAKVAL